MRKWPLIVSVVFFLSACAMPETRIYSLNLTDKGMQTKSNTAAVPSLAISLDSPQHLSQPYIVYRNSPYQLTVSKYSRWDAPPDKIVRDALKDFLYSTGHFREIRTLGSAPSGFHYIRLILKRFERTDSGESSTGELVFDIALFSPDDREIYRSTTSRKVSLDDRTFQALAKGLSSALSEGIKDAGEGLIKAIAAAH